MDSKVKYAQGLLRSGNRAQRLAGVTYVRNHLSGAEAVDVLVEALRVEKDRYVLQSLVVALGDVGDERAVSPLVDIMVNGGDREVSVLAIDSLVRLGACAVPALVDVMVKGETPGMVYASVALGRMGSVAIEPLLLILNHEDPDVTISILFALSNIGEEAAELFAIKLASMEVSDRERIIRTIFMFESEEVLAFLLRSMVWLSEGDRASLMDRMPLDDEVRPILNLLLMIHASPLVLENDIPSEDTLRLDGLSPLDRLRFLVVGSYKGPRTLQMAGQFLLQLKQP